ncbi:hypothetical protein CK203_066020 [Vitis vinifera]|uniref:Uncharacterized protein n=1 Tax=Vitis vinifera TaxID=29760 RepID=A0A438FP29_VITVI|nr:hypothetical protein CK203_066020 [Vitis vinifera]
MPVPLEPTDPSQEAPPAEQTVPHEETTTVEIETSIQSTQTTTTEPSSPHDPPTTTDHLSTFYDSDSMSLRRHHFLPVFSIALATLRAMLAWLGRRELRKEVLFKC